jgi:FixJ family two-component response regulator
MGGEPTWRRCRVSVLASVSEGAYMTPPPPVIYVVDDDASFRGAIARLLRTSGYQVVLYESATKLLDALPPVAGGGCILLDVQMPGMSGLELQERLVERGYILPVVFVTGYGNIPMGVRAVKAGAEDFLSKPIRKATLLEVVHRSILRSVAERKRHDRLSTLRALVATLTPRERDVFALVILGKFNKQIAHELGTSERTIKAHRQNVMRKLHAGSIAELVSIAHRLGAPTAFAREAS